MILKIITARAGQALVGVLVLSACVPGKPPTRDAGGLLEDGGMAVTRAQLLGAAAECIGATANEFLQKARVLESATAAHAAAPDAQTLSAARAAFHEAMTAWQRNELMLIGPAGPPGLPGGQGIRDYIYSWPLAGRCAVEEQVVSKGYTNMGTLLVNRRGLYALEYLLFYEGEDTACTGSSPIVSSGSWAALSPAERAERKRQYARSAASEVRRQTEELLTAWAAFKPALLEPSKGPYKTEAAALNALSDVLFAHDLVVQNQKLAKPLGLRDCADVPCPAALESQFAARNKANVQANLEGFRRLMEGCGPGFDGVGFDDLLVGVGAGETAEKVRTASKNVQAALDAIDEPDLLPALTQDYASVKALWEAHRAITTLLKTELVTVLDLELPRAAEGDND